MTDEDDFGTYLDGGILYSTLPGHEAYRVLECSPEESSDQGLTFKLQCKEGEFSPLPFLSFSYSDSLKGRKIKGRLDLPRLRSAMIVPFIFIVSGLGKEITRVSFRAFLD